MAKISDHWLDFYGKSPFGEPKSSKMRAFGGLGGTLACLWASIYAGGQKRGSWELLGPILGRVFAQGSILAPKMEPVGPPRLPKLGQNESKIHPKFVPKSIRFFVMRLDHVGLPKWMQI